MIDPLLRDIVLEHKAELRWRVCLAQENARRIEELNEILRVVYPEFEGGQHGKQA